MTSVLLQKHRTDLRSVAYFSAELNPVAVSELKRLRATAEKALSVSRDILGYMQLTLVVPHAGSLIVY